MLTLPPRLVFVDTSAFVALTIENDQHHQLARSLFRVLTARHTRLYTTNYVVAETHATLIRAAGHQTARTVLRQLYASAERPGSLTVIRAAVEDEEQARLIVYQHVDKDYSLVDALSFSVMERLRISHAFAFDHHFAQYGWTLLQP